jgi:hypothetical protein
MMERLKQNLQDHPDEKTMVISQVFFTVADQASADIHLVDVVPHAHQQLSQ